MEASHLIATVAHMWGPQLSFICQTQHLVRRSVTCTPTRPAMLKVWTSNSRHFFANSSAESGLWIERTSTVSQHTQANTNSSPTCSSLTHCSVFCSRLFGPATEPLSLREWSSHFKYAGPSRTSCTFHCFLDKCLIGVYFFSQRHKPGRYIHRDSMLPSGAVLIGKPD